MKKNRSKSKINLVSIILPTYNEVENIIPLIEKIEKVVKYKKQLIVVDDNSPDRTSKKVRQYINNSKDRKVILETRLENPGLTNSIQRGINIASGDVIVWMDCDLSMPPDVINKLLSKIEAGFDIAVGSRFVKDGGFIIDYSPGKKDSLVAIVLSRLMNYTIQRILGGELKDYTSGFIASKRTVFSKIALRGDYGEYFIDLMYKASVHNFKITEIGYICAPRERGKSKTGQNLWQYFKRGKKYIFMTILLYIEKNFFKKF